MRKNLTLLLLLGSFYSASAQVPFPSANAVWAQRHGNGEASPDYAILGIKTDDVTIGSNTYHKLYKSANDMVLDAGEYIGGLREDATTGRVYYYDQAAGSERMLYDFSLAVGDTVFNGSGGSPEGIVYSVDTVTIASVARRRITFKFPGSSTPWGGGTWVQGIGNTGVGGLLGSVMAQPTCDCATNTICLTLDGNEKYHNASYASLDCSNIVSTSHASETILRSGTVSVFPNPVTGVSQIQITGKEKYLSLTISNMVGQLIKSIDVTNTADVMLDKNSFVPGIYIYHLQGEAGNTLSGKFVVE